VSPSPDETLTPGTADYALAHRAGYLLRRSHRLHGRLWSALAPMGMTSPQYGVLSVIHRHPGIDQTTLGGHTSLDRATVANIVARLVDRGTVRREPDTLDARRRRLTLDPASAAEVEHGRAAAKAVWSDMFGPVPSSDREEFVAQLRQLAGFDSEELDAGALFRRLEQRRSAAWSEIIGEILTGAQYAVVHVVRQYPGVSQTELGKLAAVDRSTVAELLDRLEDRGWVIRTVDAADARFRRVFLSEEAVNTLRDLDPSLARVQRRLLEPVEPRSRAVLLENWALLAYRGAVPSAAR